MCIESTTEQTEGIRSYFHSYRNEGCASSLNSAKQIAFVMGVEPSFIVKYCAYKTIFYKTECEEVILQAGEIGCV